jgi:hypothetical protein
LKLIHHSEILDGVLFAAIFDDPSYKGQHELERLLNSWRDRLYLTGYFQRNLGMLQTFFWNTELNGNPFQKVTITQSVDRTIDDANLFGKRLLELADGKFLERI